MRRKPEFGLIEFFVSDQKQIGHAPESLYPLFLRSAAYGILEFRNQGSVVKRRKRDTEPVEALLRRLLIVGKYDRIRKAFKKLIHAQSVRARRFRPLVGFVFVVKAQPPSPREILRFTAH